jgi:hypothetical protein
MRIKEQYKNQTIGTKLSIGVMINVNTNDYTDAQLDYYKKVGLEFLLEDEPVENEPVETIEQQQQVFNQKKKKYKSNGQKN